MGEKEQNINSFIASITGVNRDLGNWERLRNMTGEMPPKEEIEREWVYLSELMDLAKKLQIDKNVLVCEHSKICIAKFIQVAPEVALK